MGPELPVLALRRLVRAQAQALTHLAQSFYVDGSTLRARCASGLGASSSRAVGHERWRAAIRRCILRFAGRVGARSPTAARSHAARPGTEPGARDVVCRTAAARKWIAGASPPTPLELAALDPYSIGRRTWAAAFAPRDATRDHGRAAGAGCERGRVREHASRERTPLAPMYRDARHAATLAHKVATDTGRPPTAWAVTPISSPDHRVYA
jgi:hypothetical protein